MWGRARAARPRSWCSRPRRRSRATSWSVSARSTACSRPGRSTSANDGHSAELDLRAAQPVVLGRVFVGVTPVGMRALIVRTARHVVDAAVQLRLDRIPVRTRTVAVRFDPRFRRGPGDRPRLGWERERRGGPLDVAGPRRHAGLPDTPQCVRDRAEQAEQHDPLRTLAHAGILSWRSRVVPNTYLTVRVPTGRLIGLMRKEITASATLLGLLLM